MNLVWTLVFIINFLLEAKAIRQIVVKVQVCQNLNVRAFKTPLAPLSVSHGNSACFQNVNLLNNNTATYKAQNSIAFSTENCISVLLRGETWSLHHRVFFSLQQNFYGNLTCHKVLSTSYWKWHSTKSAVWVLRGKDICVRTTLMSINEIYRNAPYFFEACDAWQLCRSTCFKDTLYLEDTFHHVLLND